MTTAIPCIDCTSITNYPRVGIGPESDTVGRMFVKIDHDNMTITLRSRVELLSKLNEIYENYSKPDWDGYGASPITDSVYFEGEKLIRALPIDPVFPMPEIIAEPTGEIAFEWYKEKRQVLILSISGKNEIVYSGLFGVNKSHGTEYFADSLPLTIMNLLGRLYS
jgi:hypothetical protein